MVKGVDAATAALKGGQTAAFLQRDADAVRSVSRAVEKNQRLSSDAKQRVSAFLVSWLTAETQ